jgi:hypothetical protein
VRAALLAALLIVAPAGAGLQAFRTHAVPGYGISVGLPSSWRALDYRSAVGNPDLEKIANENPELAGVLGQLSRRSSAIKFFAFDPAASRGFATNLNIVVVGLSRRISLATYRAALVSEIRGIASVRNIRSSLVRLPAGTAVRLSYNLSFRQSGRTITTSTLQYAFLRNSSSVVFTYTTVPSLDKLYAPTFAASARSIRFA